MTGTTVEYSACWVVNCFGGPSSSNLLVGVGKQLYHGDSRNLSPPDLTAEKSGRYEKARIDAHRGRILSQCVPMKQYCDTGNLNNYILQATKQTTKEKLKEQIRQHSHLPPEGGWT
ncbi:putative serine/threonine-protein kinase iks1 [Rhizina undulata]